PITPLYQGPTCVGEPPSTETTNSAVRPSPLLAYITRRPSGETRGWLIRNPGATSINCRLAPVASTCWTSAQRPADGRETITSDLASGNQAASRTSSETIRSVPPYGE